MKISNIEDLKSEINRLSIVKTEQEAYLINQYDLLKNKIATPMRVANSMFSAVPGVGIVKNLLNKKVTGKSNSDWLTRSLQFGLPLVLNRTLLKNAGWIKKGLVLLASETAAGQVNQSKVGNLFSKLTEFIRPKKKRVKEKLKKGLEQINEEAYETIDRIDESIEIGHDKINSNIDDFKSNT